MIIGIVGLGIIGKAIQYGMEKLGHTIVVHDIKLATSLENLVEADICFVCVPTPSNKDGSCDTSIVEQVVSDLFREHSYEGIVAIKSTIPPGTTERLGRLYSSNSHSLCFVPEFLRERHAITDFIENHDVCAVGTLSDTTYNLVKEAHGSYPKQFVQLSPTEAEFLKYFNNVHNATLITFANAMHAVCEAYSESVGEIVDYTVIKRAAVLREHIYDRYLDVNEKFRGWSGPCIPKDVRAMAALSKDLGAGTTFFQDILAENAKYPATIFEGMRDA